MVFRSPHIHCKGLYYCCRLSITEGDPFHPEQGPFLQGVYKGHSTMIMHRCKTLWLLVLSPGLKGPEPPLLSYTTDLPGPCFWIAEHLLDMAWVCSRTLGCFFRRCLLILDRPSTASAKNLTSGRDPRPLHRLSPRECCANLPEGTECSRGSGRLWRKPVYSYIHQRGMSLLTVDLYIPLFQESLPLAGSHVLAPFQSYHFSVRGNLYKA